MGDSGAIYRLYLDTPRVLIADLTVKADALRFSLDLRRDGVKIATTATRFDQLFYARVLQGVFNGALERLVLEHFAGSPRGNGPSPASVSTSTVFESVFAAGAPTVLVTRGSAALGSEVSEDVRARIADAVAQGDVVVAPQRPVIIGGTPRLAWWQIEPGSGATIAVTDEGLHQDTVEAVVTRSGRSEIHLEFYVNGRHMPYQARNFANGPQARLFINGLFEQLASRNIIFTVTRWTSLM